MEPVLERCAGIDVHQATMVVTVRVPGPHGGRAVTTQTFGAMAADLLVLRDWLQAHGVTHVALESTGVYWRPLYYLLEEDFTVLLVNMKHLTHVPGRKSDVRDSEWLAQLLECGLLRGSLVPPAPIRDLRDLTRYRKRQIEDRAQEVNRLHRVLEDAGLKLATVMTDIMGVSGRAMIAAMLDGATDAVALADLARGRLRTKLPALRHALAGRFRPHQAFLVTQILAKVDFLEETIDRLTQEIDRQVAPFEPVLTRLTTIPGVARTNAITILAETTGDMSRFSTADICAAGRPCVRGKTKARGNAGAAKRARATATCAAPSSKPAWRARARAGPPCRPATIGSNATGGTRKRSSPSGIRSWKLRITSCVTTSPIANSAPITSLAATVNAPSVGM